MNLLSSPFKYIIHSKSSSFLSLVKILTILLLTSSINSNVIFLSANSDYHNMTEIQQSLLDTNSSNYKESQLYKDLITNMTQHFIKENEVHMDFWVSLFQSIISTFFSEITDKTFILIFFFSSKCEKGFLLLSSIISLIFMNLISISIGYTIDHLLYKRFIDWIVLIGLFYLGVNIVRDSFEMSSKTLEDKYISQVCKKEKRKLSTRNSTDSLKITRSRTVSFSGKTVSKNRMSFDEDLCQPLLDMETAVQNQTLSNFKLFWLIFSTLAAAECGDNSQITTILISAIFDIKGVILGTTLALLICISLNIYLGNKLAKYIREKQISFVCGSVCILYGIEILLRKFKYI